MLKSGGSMRRVLGEGKALANPGGFRRLLLSHQLHPRWLIRFQEKLASCYAASTRRLADLLQLRLPVSSGYQPPGWPFV